MRKSLGTRNALYLCCVYYEYYTRDYARQLSRALARHRQFYYVSNSSHALQFSLIRRRKHQVSWTGNFFAPHSLPFGLLERLELPGLVEPRVLCVGAASLGPLCALDTLNTLLASDSEVSASDIDAPGFGTDRTRWAFVSRRFSCWWRSARAIPQNIPSAPRLSTQWGACEEL